MSKWRVLSYQRGSMRDMDQRFYNNLDEARKQQAEWLATKPEDHVVVISELS